MRRSSYIAQPDVNIHPSVCVKCVCVLGLLTVCEAFLCMCVCLCEA